MYVMLTFSSPLDFKILMNFYMSSKGSEEVGSKPLILLEQLAVICD